MITTVTERVIEPQLRKQEYLHPVPDSGPDAGVIFLFGLVTLPASGALRHPDTGVLIGSSPFMNGLIGLILVVSLVTGVAFGVGTVTFKNVGQVIAAVQKTVPGLSGMIVIFFLISRFVTYFSFSNLATILAVVLADMLKTENIASFPLLLGFILVVAIIIKWATRQRI